jgi:hypothetical protein
VCMAEATDHLIAIHHPWQRLVGRAGIRDKRKR